MTFRMREIEGEWKIVDIATRGAWLSDSLRELMEKAEARGVSPLSFWEASAEGALRNKGAAATEGPAAGGSFRVVPPKTRPTTKSTKTPPKKKK